jgi:hypothetical protein
VLALTFSVRAYVRRGLSGRAELAAVAVLLCAVTPHVLPRRTRAVKAVISARVWLGVAVRTVSAAFLSLENIVRVNVIIVILFRIFAYALTTVAKT